MDEEVTRRLRDCEERLDRLLEVVRDAIEEPVRAVALLTVRLEELEHEQRQVVTNMQLAAGALLTCAFEPVVMS